MELTLLLLSAVVLSFILNLVLTPIILTISHRNSWYDRLDSRKIHTEKTPRLGGVGLFLSFLIAAIIMSIVLPLVFSGRRDVQFLNAQNLLMLTGFLLVHLLGILDDFKDIRALYKLIGQIIAGSLVAVGGALIDGIYLPLTGWVLPLGPLSGAVTIFWLISISNAMNFIDGMDGLSGSISVVAAAAIGGVHLLLGNTFGALFSFLYVGSLLGFLVFNKPKAKIFMGDGGSLFNGFILGALAFVGAEQSGDGPQFLAGFVLTITVLAVPIIDMIAAILRRLRKRKPVYHPDQEHLHHKLLAFGLSTWSVLGIITLANLLMAASVLYWGYTRRLGSNWQLGDAVLLLALLVAAVLFVILHYAYRRRRRLTET